MSKASKKQCEIVPIEDNRMRKAALRQRQPILVKKAMELSILCKCAVRLTIWNEWTNELIHYESAPAAVPSHLAPAAALSNADYASLFDDAAASTPAAQARALDSFVRSPKSANNDSVAVATSSAVGPVATASKKRPRVSDISGRNSDHDNATNATTNGGGGGGGSSDATAPSVKLSRKLHEVIESKSKQQQQQQQQHQLPRMSPRLRANMPPPFSADNGVVGAQPPAMANSTSLHSFLPPLPMPVSAAGAARNRKKLSVVIPDTPTLHAIPAQHLDASAIASTSLTSQSPAGAAPPLSAFLMPPASARQTRSLGIAPSLDIQMSPLASPNFFDRPSPMTRSALASLLSASSSTVAARSSAPSGASLFLPTPSLRHSSAAAATTNAGPFGNMDVFTPK